jgi:hypothetical protein
LEAFSTHVTRSVRARGLAVTATVALVTALAGAAHAQDNVKQADALFNEAKPMLEKGDFEHACPKLRESYRIDPTAVGTLLALAICEEGLGRTATAWREFRAVVDASLKDRQDRAEFARKHITKLEQNLSRLTVSVSNDVATLPGLEVTVDGARLASSSYGAAEPVDPGSHEVAARATGKKPWKSTANVGADRDAQTVAITALDDDPNAVAAPAASPQNDASVAPAPGPSATAAETPQPTPSSGSGKKTLGFVVGGIGLVAVGVGSYFGITAISKSSDAKSLCPSGTPCTNQDAVTENADAKTAATIATVAIGVGIVGLAVGAYLVLTAPSSSAPSTSTALRVSPIVGPRQTGVSLSASF